MRKRLKPKAEVKIELAPAIGFCAGVGKAVRILEDCSHRGMPVETLGPVVHNRQVVERLASLGIQNINHLESAKGPNIGITAHGTKPAILEAIRARKFKVIDTTCSIVRRSQRAVSALTRSKFSILIFGEPSHPEVEGLLGWAGPGTLATLDAGDVGKWATAPRKLGIISQTTQSHANYLAFVHTVMEQLFPNLDEIRVVNTICNATQMRQALTAKMAARNDLMIVVGGKQSANTRRLADTAGRLTETHLAENAAEVDPAWLTGHRHIGVVAGTSTPEETVQQVAHRLREITGT